MSASERGAAARLDQRYDRDLERRTEQLEAINAAQREERGRLASAVTDPGYVRRMKAILCKRYGAPEDLVLEDIDPPACGPKGVRIAVRAAGVNFPDILLIEGRYQFKPPLPFAPGGEVAGEVIEVGAEVSGFAAGDRVIGMCGWNGFAEQVVVPEDKCLALPATMDDETGAVFAVTYGTSYHALVQRAALQPGEWLLVHGATGGVGTAAVQIGQILGARVIATGGNAGKLEALQRTCGVEHVIDYRAEDDLQRAVMRITGGHGADVIYDPVGGDMFEKSLRSIAWNGRLLVVGFADGAIPAARANLLLLKGCSVVGVFWGSFASREAEANRANFRTLFDWHAAGKLAPVIARRYPLERAGEAIRALIDRQIVGKAVVAIDG